MGRLAGRRAELSEKQRRKFTAKQKLEIVLAGLREDRSVRDVCREHQIQEALYYQWREQLLVAGAKRSAGKEEWASEKAKEKRMAELERVLGRKTLELEIAGKALRGWE